MPTFLPFCRILYLKLLVLGDWQIPCSISPQYTKSQSECQSFFQWVNVTDLSSVFCLKFEKKWSHRPCIFTNMAPAPRTPAGGGGGSAAKRRPPDTLGFIFHSSCQGAISRHGERSGWGGDITLTSAGSLTLLTGPTAPPLWSWIIQRHEVGDSRGKWFDSLWDQPSYKQPALVGLWDVFITISITEFDCPLCNLSGSSK